MSRSKGVAPGDVTVLGGWGKWILGTGRRAPSRLQDSGPCLSPETPSRSLEGGGRRSPPSLQSRPRHPSRAVCSLPGLKAEATPRCGQFSTQLSAGQGRRPRHPRRPVKTHNFSFPAHLESAAPTRPAGRSRKPRCPPAPCSPVRCLGFHCSAPAPPRSQLRLRACFQWRLQVPSVSAAFKLINLSSLSSTKLQLPTAFER